MTRLYVRVCLCGVILTVYETSHRFNNGPHSTANAKVPSVNCRILVVNDRNVIAIIIYIEFVIIV